MFFNRLCKALLVRNPPKPQRFDLCLAPAQKLFFSSRARPASNDTDALPPTASYLVSSLGFSPGSALATSRSVPLVNPNKAAEVVSAFDRLGFSRAQISRIIVKLPRALSFTPDRIILPKVEFLRGKGASEAEVVKIICVCPRILCRSLDGHIVPTFNVIRGCLQSDSQAIISMTRCASFWFIGKVSAFVRNLDSLKVAGVPDDNIRFLLRNHPNCLWTSLSKFDHALERVMSMGANPLQVRFVVMLNVIVGLAKSTWEKKFSFYRRWGWSKDDTLRAFVKFPLCLMISEKKLMAMMEFFVNKMGLERTYLITNPVVFSLSLKNRILPRCTVIEALVSKKLIQSFSLTNSLIISDISFEKRFVSPYSIEYPGLQKMYLEKLGLRSVA